MLKYFKTKEKTPVPKRNYTTIHPPLKLSFEEWCKNFNVSLLWDRKVVHIN